MTAQVKRWVLANSLLASVLLHAALFGGGLGYIHWRESQLAHSIDIDLRGQSLLARMANLQGGASAYSPPEPWILATGRAYAPPPKAVPLSATVQVQEDAGPPCPPPCPENPGDWVPAAATSRRPAGYAELFSEEDFPRELRQSGQEGRAEAELLIDAAGRIRQVIVLKSSHPQLNTMIQNKLMQARIQPAYDANGEAVACRLKVPFRFELQ